MDDNVFETAIRTFRKVSDAALVVTTDNVPKALRDEWTEQYNVLWDVVPQAQMEKRRATCKIERLRELALWCDEGDCILVADVDTYFISDPFVPFTDFPELQVGLTTRGYAYPFPINAGVFFIRVSKGVLNWLDWHLEEIFKPKWSAYVKVKKDWNHYREGLDWTVGQDFLIACWNERKNLCVRVVDVGPRFNFCPAVDLLGVEKAKNMMVKALQQGSVVILHLKSDLKTLIYDGKLPDCVVRHDRGKGNWK
jgi:hypothetical protein